jgi:hypothetical protein
MPTLFLYGHLVPDDAHPGLLSGLPRRPAWARGALWRGSRPHRVFVPGADDRRVSGVLVELDDARVRVLDLVLQGPGVVRRRVEAAVGLMPVPAETWLVPDARRAAWAGYRR